MRKPFCSQCILFSVAVLAATHLGCARTDGAPNGGTSDLKSLAKQITGAVVYERDDGICKTAIGKKESVQLTEKGTYPRWSPDGKHVAFVRGDRIMRMTAEGRNEEVLATAEDSRAVNYHPNGREILFTDDNAIRSVSLDDGNVRTVIDGERFRELDISRDGSQLIATVKTRIGYRIYAFDLVDDKRWKVAQGCSASLSPDGRLVTNNARGHRKLYLWPWESGEVVKTIHAPPDNKFDNQFWSNEQDWIASKTEGDKEDIFVHQVSTDRATQVTFTGDCDRPDLFVSKVH